MELCCFAMMNTKPICLTYNGFQENTYLLPSQSGSCIIIDPGCYEPTEEQDLARQIQERYLLPVRLINTHCHIDHILGNAFIAEKFKLGLEIHQGELPVLRAGSMVSEMYGMDYRESPLPISYLNHQDTIEWDGVKLTVLLTPGHSPASICLYNEKEGWVIAGDVLFRESIGRTDLPGGDYDTLITSIKDQLYTLPDDTVVYPGHGPETTIGYEKKNNPFVLG